MKLRPRLTLFTVLLIVIVVAFTSVSTILTLGYLFRRELRNNQLTLFNNFLEVCYDALYLGDDLGIKVYSESLEKSVPGLAFAIFQDQSRRGIRMGGIESLARFNRLDPKCQDLDPAAPHSTIQKGEILEDTQSWRFYCSEMELTNLRGKPIRGTIFLGFNLEVLEFELNSIITRMVRTLMWTILLVLILGLMMAFVLAGRLTKPIQHLTEGAQAIGDGNLDTQIPIETTDELGFLAQEFNLMASKLKELDRLKDDFISSVSHELRSPLAAIAGYVELLQAKPIEQIRPEKREKALDIIHQSTERLARFINDILDLAKIKSGQMVLNKKPLKVKLLVEDLLNLFHPLLEKGNLAAEANIPSDVTDVKADIDKIRQVLTNLVSNALKFTPSGGKIRIIAKNQTDFVQLSVQDTGMGIPESAQKTIFERFKQADNAKLPPGSQKGTGLGLAIAKGIVESHGGRIWIESAVGKGTTVHFTLPKEV